MAPADDQMIGSPQRFTIHRVVMTESFTVTCPLEQAAHRRSLSRACK